MARILLLTNSQGASAEVLPALSLLSHQVRILPAIGSVLVDLPEADCLFLDAHKFVGELIKFTGQTFTVENYANTKVFKQIKQFMVINLL